MDKLKKLFGGGSKDASPSSSTTSNPSASKPSAGAGTNQTIDNPNNVILHTTLGDITCQMYSQQTPRVSPQSQFHHSAHLPI